MLRDEHQRSLAERARAFYLALDEPTRLLYEEQFLLARASLVFVVRGYRESRLEKPLVSSAFFQWLARESGALGSQAESFEGFLSRRIGARIARET